jgi:hypothetical protein
LLLAGARRKVAEPEGRSVIESLARGLTQGGVLIRYAGSIQLVLHSEHGIFGGF